jgi:hypothetical protein
MAGASAVVRLPISCSSAYVGSLKVPGLDPARIDARKDRFLFDTGR